MSLEHTEKTEVNTKKRAISLFNWFSSVVNVVFYFAWMLNVGWLGVGDLFVFYPLFALMSIGFLMLAYREGKAENWKTKQKVTFGAEVLFTMIIVSAVVMGMLGMLGDFSAMPPLLMVSMFVCFAGVSLLVALYKIVHDLNDPQNNKQGVVDAIKSHWVGLTTSALLLITFLLLLTGTNAVYLGVAAAGIGFLSMGKSLLESWFEEGDVSYNRLKKDEEVELDLEEVNDNDHANDLGEKAKNGQKNNNGGDKDENENENENENIPASKDAPDASRNEVEEARKAAEEIEQDGGVVPK